MILDHKVRQAVQGGPSLSGFVASVADPTPAPGGGSVAAHVGALAAALAQMVAGLTVGRKKYVSVEAEMKQVDLAAAGLVRQLTALIERDASSYIAVMNAYKLPTEPADAADARKNAIEDALAKAASVPLETARACAEVAELCLVVAEKGNTNAISDAGVGALLAEAACKGAILNVRINIASMSDKSRGAGLAAQAALTLSRASTAARAVEAIVERNLA
jgi:glutamate formiminotransferase/formiminotetrahydrofolate cyclodeaminase